MRSEPLAPRVLIADDQPDVLEALRLLLKGEGYKIESAGSPAAILEAIDSEEFDAVLMDLNYARDTTSGQEGLDLLSQLRAHDTTLPVVVMTAWGSVEVAVEAMRRGARDFVQKPWENARLLTIVRTQVELARALRRQHKLEAENRSLKPDVRPLLIADFLYWCSFSVCNTTFALFAARRFEFDVVHTGYVLAAFGFLGVIVQVGMVAPIVRMIGVLRTFLLGLAIAAAGWGFVAASYSVPVFLLALIPAGIGVGLCNASIVTLVSHSASKDEQGKVQGAAGALESLGRTIGPIWGNGALQKFGEGSAYVSAAAAFVVTALLMLSYHPVETRN